MLTNPQPNDSVRCIDFTPHAEDRGNYIGILPSGPLTVSYVHPSGESVFIKEKGKCYWDISRFEKA